MQAQSRLGLATGTLCACVHQYSVQLERRCAIYGHSNNNIIIIIIIINTTNIIIITIIPPPHRQSGHWLMVKPQLWIIMIMQVLVIGSSSRC